MGQTNVAISLAIAAAQSGRRVYYGTLADLITTLDSWPQPGGRDLRKGGGGGPPNLLPAEIARRQLVAMQ